jgi:ATP diphosphatase
LPAGKPRHDVVSAKPTAQTGIQRIVSEKPSAPLSVPMTPGTLDRALALVRLLRAHCPWDAEQTASTLVPHLLEETHEVVDAIHDGDAAALEGELGDLLLNLAFQIVVAEEDGTLTAGSVTDRLVAKMVRRHPHLFGGGEKKDWEALKAGERREAGDTESGVLAGLARGLDPLTRAHRIQERVAGVGFDWSDTSGAFAKVLEETEEVRRALADGSPAEVEEELGDLLFAVVNVTRLAGAHPTTALAAANRKFRRRFERLEALARERGVVLEEAGLEALDELWDELKREERGQ